MPRAGWLALAVGVALPRWTYLLAEWNKGDPSYKHIAWIVDVACLVVAALSLWRLQHKIGNEESSNATWMALAGFAGDAATTFLVPWWKAPALLVVASVALWTFGTSSWLARRCHESGAPYFLYRVFVVTIAISSLLAFLRPEWPSFPSSLIIDTAMAVQCFLVARAIKRDVSAP